MAVSDKKVAFLLTRGVEQIELTSPRQALDEAGATTTLISPSEGTIQAMQSDWDHGDTFDVDLPVGQARVEDFDMLVLPGGTLNADSARLDEGIRSLVAEQARAGRTVAAICHAPWILVDSGVASGKTMTGYRSVLIDLRNAGATVVDESAKVCTADGWTLITSRNPGDLDDFVAAIDGV